MNKYIGSVWGKWDFHVHTPYSILNDNFGFNVFEPSDDDHEHEFDEYVTKLFTKAVDENIVAIGITDYFMIDGYKRIREKYLNCPSKMKKLFPDDKLRAEIEKIFVFPNIEFRLKTFVGKSAKSVNYHVIFSDKVGIQDIEENFIKALNFQFDVNEKRSLTQYNIRCFGNYIKSNEKSESGSDILVGLKHITVDDTKIQEVLQKNIFSNKHIIAVPVDEDLSDIDWKGRDYSTRKNMYKQCHCYLTSNKKTRTWALAVGEEKSRISEFGSIKPCIWGSDAHDYEKMFSPDGDRFCWIKALPTFEGLLQILYEPKDRVIIQKECPSKRNPHQVISSIQFDDSRFTNNPIFFNDGLICIIGGKSTGKSLLLKNIAYSIDDQYSKSQEQTVGVVNGLKVVAKVQWKDGTSDNRQFVYIPQTFLNRTIDNPQKETAIDKIIEDVLHQEPKIKSAYDELKRNISNIKEKTKEDIRSYEVMVQQLNELKKEILQVGTSSSFITTINELKKNQSQLVNNVNITKENIQMYNDLAKLIDEFTEQKRALRIEFDGIDKITEPVVIFPNYCTVEKDSSISNEGILKNFPDLSEELESFLSNTNDIVKNRWASDKKLLSEKINQLIETIDKRLEQINDEFVGLKLKIQQNKQLKELSDQITNEQNKYQTALNLEKETRILRENIKNKQNEIIQSHFNYKKSYNNYCSLISELGVFKKTELNFFAKTEWKKKEFNDFIFNVFDNRKFVSFRSFYNHDLTDINEQDYDGNLLSDIWDAMTNTSTEKSLYRKVAYSSEMVLQRLFDDWYNVHYMVTNGEDTIKEMSPGKKALTLLELLINLKDTQCPILIDQPEDDLDNRSIYNELVKFIVNKKSERQIIVVTHNANVVLGADAEQIIIANQDGKDSPNNDNLRFEYRCGAIEDDEIELNNDGTSKCGILSKKGIQTQICDILEGGKTALELRSKKYTST